MYLAEMIKGEQAHIINLNKTSVKYKRLDFVGKEVAKERIMVETEDDLMRLKVKITQMLEQHQKNQDVELNTDELIGEKQEQLRELQQENNSYQ